MAGGAAADAFGDDGAYILLGGEDEDEAGFFAVFTVDAGKEAAGLGGLGGVVLMVGGADGAGVGDIFAVGTEILRTSLAPGMKIRSPVRNRVGSEMPFIRARYCSSTP